MASNLKKITGGRQTLLDAADAGHLEMLIALRDHIAREIEAGVPPRDLASLSRRLMDLGDAIAELEAAEEDHEEAVVVSVPDERWSPS